MLLKSNIDEINKEIEETSSQENKILKNSCQKMHTAIESSKNVVNHIVSISNNKKRPAVSGVNYLMMLGYVLGGWMMIRTAAKSLELKNKKNEKNVNYQEILKALKARDLADSTRAISPLKKTKDSILIDNSFNDISRPINKISLLIEREIKKH